MFVLRMSASDPKRTFGPEECCCHCVVNKIVTERASVLSCVIADGQQLAYVYYEKAPLRARR